MLQRVFQRIVAEEKASAGLCLLRGLAALVAVPYGEALRLRNELFDRGILGSYRSGCRVISVGNITLGGTGKTPLVLWLARFLAGEGRRVAVASRGYGGTCGRRVCVVSNGRTVLADSRHSGDEPQLLARRLSGVAVVCSARRVAAALRAEREFRPEVLLLDDGFQHRYVARDLDLVMLDALNPFGNGHVFPRGVLREDVSGLERAHALVLSRFDGSPRAQENRQALARRWPDKPIFTSRLRIGRLFAAKAGEKWPRSNLEQKQVAAFAGIARPDDFFQSISSLGARLVWARALPDHQPLTTALLNSFLQEARHRGPDLWLTTEKDWVRLPASIPVEMNLGVLTVELDFGEEGSRFKEVVRRRVDDSRASGKCERSERRKFG